MKNNFGEGSENIWTDKKRILGMPISFTRYTIAVKENDWIKLFVKTGILSTTIDEINLFRVRDITITQSLGQKIFGVGSIILRSTDWSDGEFIIKNIKNPYKVRNLISQQVETARDNEGVGLFA